MSNPASDVVKKFLDALAQGSFTDEYIDRHIEYISLNRSNPELAEILPWAGTHNGPVEFKKFFGEMLQAWDFLEFQIDTIFGEAEKVAVIGHFTYQSKVVKKITRSPFAIFIKVQDGKIRHFQFFEDTYDTAASFRRTGQWSIENAVGVRTVGV
ncbi:MAG: hypothetical protein JWN71_1147 [Xanthobacteraceae bacterium]|jgi:ketosteroid isomerase-like protein|nr:hypothetical protein [Xanthobacteraceae bacterium]